MEDKRPTPFPLRMPGGMRESLEAISKENGRSLNAEIVHRLEESFDPAKAATGDEQTKLITARAEMAEEFAQKATHNAEAMMYQAMNLAAIAAQMRKDDIPELVDLTNTMIAEVREHIELTVKHAERVGELNWGLSDYLKKHPAGALLDSKIKD
ncbi:Arc family DNA-binding protein [Marinobacterium stanieri]|uniref:Arc family DNA-binding protein n=1 Tax=Marinobacterium stanieri TaxID=49186 RepID=UPI000255A5FA|nr:Arc family DNA-binding protein [Marinobacterium stanieri]